MSKVAAATVEPGDRVYAGLVASVSYEGSLLVWQFVSPTPRYRNGLSLAPTTEVSVQRGTGQSRETAAMWAEAHK